MEIFKKIVLIMVLLLFVVSCCQRPAITKIERDTISITVKERAFSLADSLKIKVVSDSSINIKPFIGELTKAINQKDTVLIKYFYPQNRIELKYITPPDTSRREVKERKEIQTITRSRAWWEIPLFISIGIALVLVLYVFRKVRNGYFG